MRTLILAALTAMLLTGCFRNRVVTNKPPSGVHHLTFSHTFIGGLIGSQTEASCEPAVVETRVGLIGLLAAVITVGIWVPFTVDIECAAGSSPGAISR